MLAILTSIGETTTDLCRWSLERNGFTVRTIIDPSTSLWAKLKLIYETTDEDFLRVDADVVVNAEITPEYLRIKKYSYDFHTSDAPVNDVWWGQFQCYDWLKQDLMYGGVQFIRREALEALRKHIDEFENAYRPETYLYRLDEFTKPVRRCMSIDKIAGLHGFGQDNIERIKATKEQRGQMDNYDFELSGRLDDLHRNVL